MRNREAISRLMTRRRGCGTIIIWVEAVEDGDKLCSGLFGKASDELSPQLFRVGDDKVRFINDFFFQVLFQRFLEPLVLQTKWVRHPWISKIDD